MFYRSFLALILSFFIFSSAFSQGFVVTGSYPSNGQAGLPIDPIQVLLRLGFSKPVNLGITWPKYSNIPLGPFNFLAFDPEDSIELGQPYSSPNADTVGIFVKLRPETDYCIILYGAYSQDGELLNKPYVLNFTTSASIGTRKVSGSIIPPSRKISSFRFDSQLNNLKDIKLKLPSEFGGKEISSTVLKKFENFNFSFKNFDLSQPLEISSIDPNTGVVALLDGNPLVEGTNAKYAANINSDFSFEVKYVRDGSYYLFVAFDTERDGIFELGVDLLMFYDENGDGQPDPINVSGGDVTGLNVSGVLQARPFTIREKLDTVMSIARSYTSDAVLREISAFEEPPQDDNLDGKFYFANYGFYSASRGEVFRIYVDAFGGINLYPGFYLEGKVNLPETFVDSDVAFDSAEANGGFAFRSEPNTITYIFYALRNYPENELPPDTINPYWRLSYVKYYQVDGVFYPVGFANFYLNPSDGRLVKKFETSFIPVTAKEKFGEIDGTAKSYAGDAQLMFVVGGEADTIIDGRAHVWVYGYKSPTKGKFSVWYLMGAIVTDISDTAWFDLPFDITKPLNFDSYKDSDVLAAVGENFGGSWFRSNYQLISMTYAYFQSPFDTTIYFYSIYQGLDTTTGRIKEYIVLVDPVSGMFAGAFTKVEKDATVGIPTNFALYQNYPNPFNPTTTITYDIPLRANVKLTIYNVLGQKVAILVDEVQEPGRYNVTFNANDLPSGVYFYRLEADKFVQMRKMLLVK